MRAAGIDVGSARSSSSSSEHGEAYPEPRMALTSHDPLETARDVMEGSSTTRSSATGYGRHLVKDFLECPVISEIKAFAMGARGRSCPVQGHPRIGGQDTKAISLERGG